MAYCAATNKHSGSRLILSASRRISRGSRSTSMLRRCHRRVSLPIVSQTLKYYDDNAQAFYDGTVSADMAQGRARFIEALPPGGRILDAGCGSGRDALAFNHLGFDVTAFDGSAEMVRLATNHTGLEVLQLTFEEVDWRETFDGIWANASLLHVPRDQLVGVMRKLRDALVIGGVWELSFKPGAGEGVAFGRWFTNLSEADVPALIAEVGGLEILAVTSSYDVRTGKSQEGWTNILVRRGNSAVFRLGPTQGS